MFTAKDAPKASFIDDAGDAALWASHANKFLEQNNHPDGAKRMADEAMKRREKREPADAREATERKPGMPFTAADAHRHSDRAKTDKQARRWAHVANGVLNAKGTDAAAITEANGVIKREEKPSRAKPPEMKVRPVTQGPPFQRDMVSKGRFRGPVGQI